MNDNNFPENIQDAVAAPLNNSIPQAPTQDFLGGLGEFVGNTLSWGTGGLLPDSNGEHHGPLGEIVTKLFGHDPWAADEWHGAMDPTRPRSPSDPRPDQPGLDGSVPSRGGLDTANPREVGEAVIPGSARGKSISAYLKSKVTPDTYGPAKPPITPNLMVGGNVSNVELASKFLGKSEHKDASALSSFFEKSAGLKLNPANTAWCAAFANSVLGANGQKGTGSLMAKSFLHWGQESSGEKGDVVVLTRGNPNSPYGHVGFVVKRENGKVWVLGGNQSDAVTVSVRNESDVLGYRRAAQRTASKD